MAEGVVAEPLRYGELVTHAASPGSRSDRRGASARTAQCRQTLSDNVCSCTPDVHRGLPSVAGARVHPFVHEVQPLRNRTAPEISAFPTDHGVEEERVRDFAAHAYAGGDRVITAVLTGCAGRCGRRVHLQPKRRLKPSDTLNARSLTVPLARSGVCVSLDLSYSYPVVNDDVHCTVRDPFATTSPGARHMIAVIGYVHPSSPSANKV